MEMIRLLITWTSFRIPTNEMDDMLLRKRVAHFFDPNIPRVICIPNMANNHAGTLELAISSQ